MLLLKKPLAALKCSSMQDLAITFIVGLTAVGKTTTLEALQNRHVYLLPNRRELTDTIIIPDMQEKLGQPKARVIDRLERFSLTKAYREHHPEGIIHALKHYIDQVTLPTKTLLFDNIRGLNECQAAHTSFSNARFLFLDAPYRVRLERLIGRNDAFDRVTIKTADKSFEERLQRLYGIEFMFSQSELEHLYTSPQDKQKAILDALSILSKEYENYNSEKALKYLQTKLDDKRLLYLDSSKLGLSEVVKKIEAWL